MIFTSALPKLTAASPQEIDVNNTVKQAYIVDGIRTPFGRYGGGLSSIRADDLAALPLKHLLQKHSHIDWGHLDEVILGCANQAGEDNRNIARMALLLAGIPHTVPGITVNRLCASGLEAVSWAGRQIRAGEADLILAGGVESMTRAPYVLGKAETPFSRHQKVEDTSMGWRFINPQLKAKYGVESMPETAEIVAQEFKIPREAQDAFAYRSQKRAEEARVRGVFQEEIIPVSLPLVKGKKELQTFSYDEQVRETTIEGLAKLKGIVHPEGTVTAGNSSGINDGAVALLIASEEALKRYSLNPLARIVKATASGVLPKIMGMGPVPAVKKLLEQNKIKLTQVDLIELNEAFAAQAIAVLRELSLPENADFINPHGGAISLGHPLGASGARLALHASLELKRRPSARYAICTLCVGVGQGAALLLERV